MLDRIEAFDDLNHYKYVTMIDVPLTIDFICKRYDTLVEGIKWKCCVLCSSTLDVLVVAYFRHDHVGCHIKIISIPVLCMRTTLACSLVYCLPDLLNVCYVAKQSML